MCVSDSLHIVQARCCSPSSVQDGAFVCTQSPKEWVCPSLASLGMLFASVIVQFAFRHFLVEIPCFSIVAAVVVSKLPQLCPVEGIVVTEVFESQFEQCFDFVPADTHEAGVSTVHSVE